MTTPHPASQYLEKKLEGLIDLRRSPSWSRSTESTPLKKTPNQKTKMKKQPAIIALIITAVGLAVAAPYSQARPTNKIPGQSKAQKDRQEARLKSERSGGSGAAEGHANHYHSKKTGR